MAQVHDWELEEPFKDLMDVLKLKPQIRKRDDVNSVLTEVANVTKRAHHAMLVAVQKQRIVAAEGEIEAAEKTLLELEPPQPF